MTSARKFNLNNDLSCPDNKKNDRHLQTVCMFCAITSLLVRFRKSSNMAFEDDTSVENTRPFLTVVRTSRKFYLNLAHFKEFFVWEETSKLIFLWLACLTKKFAYYLDRILLETALSQISNETDGSMCSSEFTWSDHVNYDGARNACRSTESL